MKVKDGPEAIAVFEKLTIWAEIYTYNTQAGQRDNKPMYTVFCYQMQEWLRSVFKIIPL